MFTRWDTHLVMENLHMEAAKELGLEIAGLTAQTFPLVPVDEFAG